MRSTIVLTLLLVLAISASHCIAGAGMQAAQAASWLDRPAAGWNQPGAPIPRPGTAPEHRDALASRCKIDLHGSTPVERALAAAGWIPMPHVSRALVKDDVEIVDGVIALDAACEPIQLNAFVFVVGRFAGTLSPVLMKARTDGSAGAIRIPTRDTITVDFARYTSTDPDCCPSSHVIVRFTIDRSQAHAVVVPVEIKPRG
jgi:hypothetical protein